jgi:hypothetical protein
MADFNDSFYDPWRRGDFDVDFGYLNFTSEEGPREAPTEVCGPAADSTLSTQTPADAEWQAHEDWEMFNNLQNTLLNDGYGSGASQITPVSDGYGVASLSHQSYLADPTLPLMQQEGVQQQPLQQVIQHDNYQEQQVIQHDSSQWQQMFQQDSYQEQQVTQHDSSQWQQMSQQDSNEQQVIQHDNNQEQGASSTSSTRANKARLSARRTRRSQSSKSDKVTAERVVETEDGQRHRIQQTVTRAVADSLTTGRAMAPPKVKNLKRLGIPPGHKHRMYQPRCQQCNEKPDLCRCPRRQES